MSYHALNADFINPFIASTVAVFRTMLKIEVDRGSLYLKNGLQPSHEISGVIGLSGMAKGTVLLGMSSAVAIHATEILTGEKHEQINADVIDAVGELANMIAGSAKTKLADLNMSVSLPSVIAGKNHSISFPTGSTPIGIPFVCVQGPISLEVSLVENA